MLTCDNTILRPMSILMGPTNVCYHQLTMICAAVTFNATSPRGLNVSCYQSNMSSKIQRNGRLKNTWWMEEKAGDALAGCKAFVYCRSVSRTKRRKAFFLALKQMNSLYRVMAVVAVISPLTTGFLHVLLWQSCAFQCQSVCYSSKGTTGVRFQCLHYLRPYENS